MLSVEPIKDLAAVSAICADPYVARAGHDHRPVGAIDDPHAHYLGAYVNGELVGTFLVIETGWVELDLHSLLTKKALPWCRELGKLCIAWCFGHPIIQRVTAQIIEGLESARNYCLRLGFKVEGFRRDAIQVNGTLRGVYVLGLTRKDWSAA